MTSPFQLTGLNSAYCAPAAVVPSVRSAQTEGTASARAPPEPRCLDGVVGESPHAANDVNDAVAQTEADRYIAWPGQALAYTMGQLMIRKLRDEAKTQLGSKFDIKAFHDEILNAGAMPLDLLQERVERWIKEQVAVKR